MSALKADRVLVALNVKAKEGVHSHCCQDFGRSECYCRQECQLTPLTRFDRIRICSSLVDPHLRGNNVLHCVENPQVKEMEVF